MQDENHCIEKMDANDDPSHQFKPEVNQGEPPLRDCPPDSPSQGKRVVGEPAIPPSAPPFPPPAGPAQRLFQEHAAKSKFLAGARQ